MRFSDQLRALAAPIWEAQHAHPFVRGIGDGSLPKERFVEWVKQDYVFLIEYCRLFAFAAGRAPDFETLVAFADLLAATAKGEMELHRRLAGELGIAASDLEAVVPSPTTRAYTDFLIRTATTGDFAELAAALLPCMWGFSEIGQRLAASGRPADRHYAAWIDSYADPEFAKLAEWCRTLVDRLAEGAAAATRERMASAFLTSSRYELLFWNAAWSAEQWPA
ncbi:MAG: thiaminase II [Chloroflexota bacterium]|nr:thiaminase II [Dehalococcoidia bacterium]MDW8254002.1 thiaminase II [Chloroflexota bacterium]